MDEFIETKRIKLEHSYSNVPINDVTIKQEIEIEDVIKTEPVFEPFENENNFEYLDVKTEPLDTINVFPELPVIENIKSEVDSDNGTVTSDLANVDNKDPLALNVIPLNVLLVPKISMCNDKNTSEIKQTENSVQNLKSMRNRISQLLKDKENLQREVHELRFSLKSSVSNEKVLQIKLEAKKDIEMLIQKNCAALKNQLENVQLEKKIYQNQVTALELKLQKLKSNLIMKNNELDKLRQENKVVEVLKKKVTNQESEYKLLQAQYANDKQALIDLNQKFTRQKTEMDKLYRESNLAYEASNKRALKFQDELVDLRRNYEAMVQTVTREKTLRIHSVREASKELVNLKQSMKVILEELNETKELSKFAEEQHLKKCVEYQKTIQEYERKQKELMNKTCDYCGF